MDVAGPLKTELYIVNDIKEIYSSQGQTVNAKHIELIVRQMFSKVKITNAGDSTFFPGDIVDVISTAANSILGDDNVVWLDNPSMGSEDFAHYLKFTTGVIFRIGTGTADERSRLGLHNSSIVFGENAIFAGIATFVGTALEYFRK